MEKSENTHFYSSGLVFETSGFIIIYSKIKITIRVDKETA